MSKKGRTLKQQLIENYGQQVGLQKLAKYKEKRKYQLSQKYYIEKFGQQLGKQKYLQFREKTKFKKQTYNKKNCARTLQFFMIKYGQQLGKQKFQQYKQKQAISNTFEYKTKKFGWTKQQFQQFNKSRAVTLENLIKKHGQQFGKQKYLQYCQKQSYTKSQEYFIEKFGQMVGKQKFQQINKKKARTKENYIKKFGQQSGLLKWKQYCQKFSRHSKIADQFFQYISLFNKENHQLFFGQNQKYFFPYFIDFFNANTNKGIEFFGVYWHASPNIYSQQKIINNKTAKEIWQKDKQRIEYLEKTYNLQVKIIWQDEIKNKTLIKQLIKWIFQQ